MKPNVSLNKILPLKHNLISGAQNFFGTGNILQKCLPFFFFFLCVFFFGGGVCKSVIEFQVLLRGECQTNRHDEAKL